MISKLFIKERVSFVIRKKAFFTSFHIKSMLTNWNRPMQDQEGESLVKRRKSVESQCLV